MTALVTFAGCTPYASMCELRFTVPKADCFWRLYYFEGSLTSYQDEETVGGEVLMSRDGREHREDQAAEHQDEPKQTDRKTDHQKREV